MVDTTDDNQFEKYEKIAVFIRPNINPNIVGTYKKYIKDHEAGLYIYENYIRNIMYPNDKMPSLEDIIAVCTYIALSKENIDQAIRTYRENRRVYKRNWIQPIKEEIFSPNNMKPKNPTLLKNYANSQHLIQEMDRSRTKVQSVEEIMLEKYNELEQWRSDTTAPITDFSFLANKPIKTLSNGFVNDVTFESLIVIKNFFGGSIEGFNVKYPTAFSNYPLFNYRSTWMDFEPELIENELTFFNRYQYESDEENISGDVTVKYTPEKELPTNVSKKGLSKLLKECQVDLKQKELDMKDREIMTQLFNMINGENLNDQFISCDFREFSRKIFNIKVPRQTHYDDIANRLQKLKSYDYTITVTSKETGDVIETTSLGLLNYININYKDNIIQFTPSEQWKRTYVQKKYINILADSYKSIDSVQTKGIMMILQQERLTEYTHDSLAKTLSLKYFRAHMKLQRIGNAALVKELTNHLSILKVEQIVIKDFELVNKNSAVHIEFIPLEDKELIAYGYSPKPTLTSSEGVIDTHYKEV